MDTVLFKQIVSETLIELGFIRKRTFFYKANNDLIIVVGIQKSNNMNGFYFNVGYLIKKLHPGIEYPKDVDGDIRTRFSIIQFGKEIDILNLENLTSNPMEFIKNFLQDNTSELIDEVIENGIKWLINKYPILLYQTSLKAKKFLGL